MAAEAIPSRCFITHIKYLKKKNVSLTCGINTSLTPVVGGKTPTKLFHTSTLTRERIELRVFGGL